MRKMIRKMLSILGMEWNGLWKPGNWRWIGRGLGVAILLVLCFTAALGDTQSLITTNYIDCGTSPSNSTAVIRYFTLRTRTTVYWNIDMSRANPRNTGYGPAAYFYISGNGLYITSLSGSSELNPGNYEAHSYGGRFGQYSPGVVSGYLYYNDVIYDRSYNFTFDGNHTQDYSMYFPANTPRLGGSGYTVGQALNSVNNLITRPYKIPVSYTLETGGLTGWLPDEADKPSITIYTYNPSSGAKIEYDKISGRDARISGTFNLQEDHGVYISVHVGRSHAMFNTIEPIRCIVTLRYRFDETKPSKPTGLKVLDIQDNNIINGKIYTNLDRVRLQWNQASDSGTPSSGIAGYKLICNGSERYITQNSYTDASNPLFAAEGQYTVRVKSQDKEGHESDLSDPLTIVIDRSVSPVTLPSNPVQFAINPDTTYNVTLTWNRLLDEPGVSKYLVAITNSPEDPKSNLEEVSPEQTQCTFYNLSGEENVSKYLHIQAFDSLGNQSVWTHTNAFKLWSLPATITAQAFATVVNGVRQYKVDLKLENQADAAQYVIERTGPNPIAAIVLTREQLSGAGFKYTDTNNLAPHGKYTYSVYTKNSYEVPSVKNSATVTIPNIPSAANSIVIKDNSGQAVAGPSVNTKDLYANLAQLTDMEGDQFQFRLHYRNLDTGITGMTPVFQSTDIAIELLGLPDGNYEFWLEYQEIANNTPVSTPSFTARRTLAIDTLPPSGSLEPYCIDVNYEVNHGTPGQSLNFNVRAEGYEPAQLRYEWDFGDGGTAVGKEATHIYTSLGTYNVTLRIIDADDNITTKQVQIVITNTTRGRLYANETWGGAQPHVVKGDIYVPEDITLTISPGAVIKVKEECGLYIRGVFHLEDPGRQTGFTAYNAQLHWKGIIFEGQSSGIVNGGNISTAIRGLAILDHSQVTISNCVFSNSHVGIHICETSPTISGCSFVNNIYGIKEDKESPDGSSNPTVSNCTGSGNKIDYYDENSTVTSLP